MVDPTLQPSGASRRRLLTGAALGAATALSGCVDTLPFGSEPAFEPVDVPESEPPEFRSSVPVTAALPGDPPTSVVQRVTPADTPPGGFIRSTLAGRPDWLGTALEAHDEAIGVGPVIAFVGGIDPATVADAVEGTGYEPSGTYAGYELHAREDPRGTVAVTDGVAIWSGHERGRAAVEAVVDARETRIDRRHEANAAFETVTAPGVLDADVIGELGPGLEATAGASMQATSFACRDDLVYTRFQSLYGTAADVPVERIETEIRDGDAFNEAAAVEVRGEGRRAVIETRQERDSDPGTRTRVPRITWGVDYDAADSSLTLRHEAGQSAEADTLAVTFGSVPVDGVEGAPDVSQFVDKYDTVGPGDGLTIEIPGDADRVTVVFSPNDRSSSLLFGYDLDRPG